MEDSTSTVEAGLRARAEAIQRLLDLREAQRARAERERSRPPTLWERWFGRR